MDQFKRDYPKLLFFIVLLLALIFLPILSTVFLFARSSHIEKYCNIEAYAFAQGKPFIASLTEKEKEELNIRGWDNISTEHKAFLSYKKNQKFFLLF